MIKRNVLFIKKYFQDFQASLGMKINDILQTGNIDTNFNKETKYVGYQIFVVI